MSYYHPTTMHPALARHHEEMRHRLVSDPVNVAPGGAVDPLTYHGGPTMTAPKVVLLYSGQFWDDKTAINTFLKAVVEDGYADAAKGEGTQRGTFLGAFDIAAPPSASVVDQDCRTMIRTVVGQNGIPTPDANTLFMLALPQGVAVSFTAGGDSSCSSFCGYHSNDELNGVPLLYTVQPATTCDGCYQTNPRTGFQMVLAHEFIEAATDPTGQGWFNDSTGAENADEAAWVQDQYGQWVTQGYAAQNASGQWVNSIGTYVAPTGNGGGGGNGGGNFQSDPNLTRLYAWLAQASTYMQQQYALGTAAGALEAANWELQAERVLLAWTSYVQGHKSAALTALPVVPTQ
jgi:hypothetical protein